MPYRASEHRARRQAERLNPPAIKPKAPVETISEDERKAEARALAAPKAPEAPHTDAQREPEAPAKD